MTLDDLKRLIETANWFANLGKAITAPGLVPVTDSDWQRFMHATTCAEFGLPHGDSVFEKPLFWEMTWLPTANEETDPIHGCALEDAACHLNREDKFKAARIEAFRLALVSQRKVPELPALKVGATDSNNPARMAGRFACRLAASEIVVDQVGFWCEMVRLFHKGHWPFGRLPSGEIAVL
ncbi:MAG: hypothetical protein R3B84_16840 [Zavarzinella sp.]